MYNKEFVAVQNLSFELPKNRITVLLGHNGAGKTTTMQMITGCIRPTSGTILVGGESDIANYRTVIGYCPQDDVFINYLNCRDQLVFYGCIRGLSFAEANEKADEILENANMTETADKLAKTLSCGMKRRLCLACAIIGQTKVVILDEPSTGLDPESRRALWDIILNLRRERTILLSTHSLEEADVLGDNIIIMNQGEILCKGTQFDLKHAFGTGYTLKMLTTDVFDVDRMMSKIREFIPNATLKLQMSVQTSVLLPYESVEMFASVLSYLEKNRIQLGIKSISIANTTMEEVFLK